MTLTYRLLTTGAALTLIAALAVTTVAAQGGTGAQAPGSGPGGRRPMAALGAALSGLQRLDLTDAQRDQIRTLIKDRRQADQSGMKGLELQRQLRAAVLADTPDLAQIEQLKTSIAEAEATALAARIDLQMQIAQILTPEQRAKAREMQTTAGRGPRQRPDAVR